MIGGPIILSLSFDLTGLLKRAPQKRALTIPTEGEGFFTHTPFQDALKVGAKNRNAEFKDTLLETKKPSPPSWHSWVQLIFLVPAGRTCQVVAPTSPPGLANVVLAKLLAMSKPMTIATPSWAIQKKGQRVEGPLGDDTKQKLLEQKDNRKSWKLWFPHDTGVNGHGREIQRNYSWWTWSMDIPSLKLTVRTWKWMVGILSRFLLGWPIWRGELLVSGRVNHMALWNLNVTWNGIETRIQQVIFHELLDWTRFSVASFLET